MHLIGRYVRGDRNIHQSRAHPREVRRRKDEHLHGKLNKREGHDKRHQVIELLLQATPFGASETFDGRVKESVPRFFRDDGPDRGGRFEGSEMGHGIERIDQEEGECRGGITSSSLYSSIGISFT